MTDCPLCTGGQPVHILSVPLFHECGHLEQVFSSPLCASDVQYNQEFYTIDHHIRDLNYCADESWFLYPISPTP